MRWVGIDEAGYGPNLGPMVMTAVAAEAPDPGRAPGVPVRAPDLWRDLAGTIDRAGGNPARLWVDDSKAILRGGKGRERIEAGCLAAVHAAGLGLPATLADLLAAIKAGTPADAELLPWCDADAVAVSWPWCQRRDVVQELLERRTLEPDGESWRLAAIHTVVVGPCRFNRELESSDSKAEIHFGAFAQLLRAVWDRAIDGVTTSVTGDKHGGRHYYLEPLSRSFSDAWIDRGHEGPGSSRYTIRDSARRLELNLIPKADRDDGLVALASIISKTVRELWMDGFNRYWCDRVPGLRPTAGYPVDARRFRSAIEEAATASGCDPAIWWRVR
ncbi:MAG: hypothetical protein ACLQGP_28205 [Isosphaeraceae bacterium]